MGVRMYPITDDPAKLEKLCRVNTGTADKLRRLSESEEFRARGEDYRDACQRRERLLDAFHEDEDLWVYHNFLSRGWGKFFDESWMALEEWHRARGLAIDSDAGECRDPDACAATLAPLFLNGDGVARRFMEGLGVQPPSRYNVVGHETALDLARLMFSLAEGVKWS